VYNGEPFLREALDAILAQTYEDFEVIVSDNASTDGTQAIVEEYARRDSRVSYVRQDRNIGASANFDFVRRACRSEYFKWFAADDACSPGFLKACVEVLDSRPDVGLVYAPAACIDEESRTQYAFADLVTMPSSWSRDPFVRTRQAFAALLQDGSVANVMVFGVVRSAVLDTVRPIGNYFGADLPFVAELVAAAGVVELPTTMSFLRRHVGSSSTYARAPSAVEQQAFYDPSVRGRLRLQWNLRRRYAELLRVAATAPVGASRRLGLVLSLFLSVTRRVLWRVRFEFDERRAIRRPGPSWADGPVHWSEV
jgi:glycosyltransferase involved in cell wall biosynthesis